MKIKPLMMLPLAIFAVIAGLSLAGLMREDPDALPSARAGQIVPAMVLDEMPGKTPFDAETLKGGGVKLVNFWASWCAPCRAEHPNLQQLADEGIPGYGVNYKDPTDNALAFLEELGDPYVATAADTQGRMGLEWGLYGVPETYVIDGNGRIILRFAGPVTQRVMAETIRPAIEEASKN